MHRKYRPWTSSARQLSSVQKTRLLKNLDAQYPKTSLFRRLSTKNTLRARGESNRVPPGSDPPTSRGPNHYANPAPESRLLSGFLCTGNTGPGRAVRVNCRPSRKTQLFEVSTPTPTSPLYPSIYQPTANIFTNMSSAPARCTLHVPACCSRAEGRQLSPGRLKVGLVRRQYHKARSILQLGKLA